MLTSLGLNYFLRACYRMLYKWSSRSFFLTDLGWQPKRKFEDLTIFDPSMRHWITLFPESLDNSQSQGHMSRPYQSISSKSPANPMSTQSSSQTSETWRLKRHFPKRKSEILRFLSRSPACGRLYSTRITKPGWITFKQEQWGNVLESWQIKWNNMGVKKTPQK